MRERMYVEMAHYLYKYVITSVFLNCLYLSTWSLKTVDLTSSLQLFYDSLRRNKKRGLTSFSVGDAYPYFLEKEGS